jgi:hydroxylamine dehydrogenase
MEGAMSRPTCCPSCLFAAFILLIPAALFASSDGSEACVDCHAGYSGALVKEWQGSRHAANGVGCLSCHAAPATDETAGSHMGFTVTALVTPRTCAKCHAREYGEFSRSHHARAGEILASLDNVLAERAAGMPGNIADAASGCWQCHGTIVRLKRDAKGAPVINKDTGLPLVLASTWPNSGIGRINPDGSKGTCNACHSRHAFEAKVARSPENCGKCHLGPDHPQEEIYTESKHGIAFQANRSRMALDKEGDWVLGKDYTAAPTCTTCHIGAYMTSDGQVVANNHDVGRRISWTLRPVVSVRINRVLFEDGYKEDYPAAKALPGKGGIMETLENVMDKGALVAKKVSRKIAEVTGWEARRSEMQGVCLNCHGESHVENFYAQYDDLVTLYNDKFAAPAQALMNDLVADKVLSANAPFEQKVQWTFYELWHHQGRRARMGASMMGPDYTHWHGMYEVARSFYTEFLPQVVETAAAKGPEMKKKYEAKVAAILARPENIWLRGLSPEESARLRESYREKYGQ